MKYSLDNLLKAGLRKETYKDKKSPGLIDAYGLVLTEFGLSSYARATNPYLAYNPVTPYPILFQGKGQITYLLGSTANTVVKQPVGLWSNTELAVINVDTGAIEDLSSGSQANEVWHLADFGSNIYATRPDKTLYYDGSNYYFTATSRYNSCCDHRGRLILGGPQQYNIFNTLPEALLDKFFTKSGLPAVTDDINTNFVIWSSIGGGDIKYLLKNSISGYLTDETDTDDYSLFLEMLKRNESGFIPMPFNSVRVVKSLGSNIVAYGDLGIGLLVQVSAPYPTFGFRHLKTTGVYDRASVCDTGIGHFFIGYDGTLFFIDPEYKITKLGYKEFISPELSYRVRMSYDELNETLYISSERAAFTLRNGGLTKCNQMVSSSMRYTGSLVGIISNLADATCYLTTDTIDFELSGLKTVDWIVLNGTYPSATPLQVSLGVRYAQDDDFTYTSYITINDEGAAYFHITGKEFRVKVKSASYLGVTIEGMSAIISYEDRRYM